MDLYTNKFGKLQKQKEQAIAKIGRERQKIIDQNNAMVRKGFGKNAKSANILSELRDLPDLFRSNEATKNFSTEISHRLEESIQFDQAIQIARGVDVNDGNDVTSVSRSTVATRRPNHSSESPSGPSAAEQASKNATKASVTDYINMDWNKLVVNYLAIVDDIEQFANNYIEENS